MALRPIIFLCKLFVDAKDFDRSHESLRILMDALGEINKRFFLAYPATPGLYQTKIRYQIELNGEEWQDVPTTLQRGYGDCDDLACYRIGELRAQGIPAVPVIEWRGPQNKRTFHALVGWPDGRIEDPSRARGMGGLPVMPYPYFLDQKEAIHHDVAI